MPGVLNCCLNLNNKVLTWLGGLVLRCSGVCIDGKNGGMAWPPFACCGMFLVLLFPWKFCWASYQFLPTGKGKSLASKLVANGARKPHLFCASAAAGTGPKHSSFSQISRNVSAMPCPVVSRNYARSLIHPWRLQNEFHLYKRSSKRDVNLYRFQICPFGPRLWVRCRAQSIKGKLFVFLSRPNCAECFKLNVVMWRCSCPMDVLKPATISGSLIHSCTYPYCQNSTSWGWNIHRQKFELQLWIVASKAPSLSRWTWEQTRDSSLANRCKQPSNEKLDRRNEHYQISSCVKCTGAGGAMRQPATFISMLANDISWSSRFTPTSYGPCFGGERTAAILHPFGHLLSQTSIPMAVDCLQSARRSGPAPSPGLIATNGKPHHFKAFAAGTRYAICRI